mmetsp:Transcript_20704/g.49752  ORF Transcript_20704/g.49752 Transcript_20704/m.49752 type:complete len:426 (-) Transcript_20704:741-2018(-)
MMVALTRRSRVVLLLVYVDVRGIGIGRVGQCRCIRIHRGCDAGGHHGPSLSLPRGLVACEQFRKEGSLADARRIVVIVVIIGICAVALQLLLEILFCCRSNQAIQEIVLALIWPTHQHFIADLLHPTKQAVLVSIVRARVVATVIQHVLAVHYVTHGHALLVHFSFLLVIAVVLVALLDLTVQSRAFGISYGMAIVQVAVRSLLVAAGSGAAAAPTLRSSIVQVARTGASAAAAGVRGRRLRLLPRSPVMMMEFTAGVSGKAAAAAAEAGIPGAAPRRPRGVRSHGRPSLPPRPGAAILLDREQFPPPPSFLGGIAGVRARRGRAAVGAPAAPARPAGAGRVAAAGRYGKCDGAQGERIAGIGGFGCSTPQNLRLARGGSLLDREGDGVSIFVPPPQVAGGRGWSGGRSLSRRPHRARRRTLFIE